MKPQCQNAEWTINYHNGITLSHRRCQRSRHLLPPCLFLEDYEGVGEVSDKIDFEDWNPIPPTTEEHFQYLANAADYAEADREDSLLTCIADLLHEMRFRRQLKENPPPPSPAENHKQHG